MSPTLKPWELLHALVTRIGTNKLTGQTALIIGAHGASLALARKLAAAGCKIALCSADQAQLLRARSELAASGCAVFARLCDASDARRVHALVQAVLHRFGSLDLLVTCPEPASTHGVVTRRSTPEGARAQTRSTPEGMRAKNSELEEALSSVFWTAYHPTMAVLPHMIARRAGRIIHLKPIRDMLGRAGSNAAGRALHGFSRGLRSQLVAEGIDVRCNAAWTPSFLSSLLAPRRPLAMTGGSTRVDDTVSSSDLRRLECFHQVRARSVEARPRLGERRLDDPATASSTRAGRAKDEYLLGPSTLLRAALGASRY